MAKKNFHLDITQEEREKWTKILVDFYSDKGYDKEDIDLKVKRILEDCVIGWNHAPKTLEKRVKFKSGWHCKSHENLRSNPDFRKKVTPPEEIEHKIINLLSLSKSLTPSERKWWKQREQQYFDEFQFNKSSDYPLLTQLLVEELIQNRLANQQLSNGIVKDTNWSKLMTESQKRLTEVQVKLGITREQRKSILDNIDGNVATISLNLDEKLKEIEKLKDKDIKEEEYYANLKKQREPNNILPSEEKIIAMVKESDEDYENQS